MPGYEKTLADHLYFTLATLSRTKKNSGLGKLHKGLFSRGYNNLFLSIENAS